MALQTKKVWDLNLSERLEMCSQSPTVKFYNGKTILITGVTGFCGKVLFEKILRVCNSVNRVYLVMRKKKNQTAEERLKELLNGRIFSFHQYPKEQFEKVSVLEGDITCPKLGLSEFDLQKVHKEVNIVFHVAASVKFDAEFSFNYLQNTKGAKNVLELCRDCENLEQFMHVSTAYSNCHLLNVPEEISPLSEDVDVILNKIDACTSKDEQKEVAQPFTQGRPNSYVFTKALAEHYLNKHSIEYNKKGGRVLSSIVRPAIVYNANNEPALGWIDSFNGPSGFSMFLLTGVVRYSTLTMTNRMQLVPVDYFANFMLSLCPYLEQNKQTVNKMSVYNVSSGNYLAIDLYTLIYAGFKYTKKYPSLYIVRNIVMPPRMKSADSYSLQLLQFIYHQVWSYCVEALIIMAGVRKKLSMIKLMDKYKRACKLVDFFVDHDWRFASEKYEQVVNAQSEIDTVLFPMDLRDLTIDHTGKSYVLGSRRYLLNEPDSTLKQARIKYQWQRRISKIIDYVFWIFFAFILVRLGTSFLQN